MPDTYRIFYFKISDPRERMSSERYGLKLIAKNDSNNAGRTRISIMDSRRCSNVCHSTILKHSRHVCPSSFVEISGKLDCQTLLFQLPGPMGTITDQEQQRTPKKTATVRERLCRIRAGFRVIHLVDTRCSPRPFRASFKSFPPERNVSHVGNCSLLKTGHGFGTEPSRGSIFRILLKRVIERERKSKDKKKKPPLEGTARGYALPWWPVGFEEDVPG